MMHNPSKEYRPPRFTEYLRNVSVSEDGQYSIAVPLPERQPVNLAELIKSRQGVTYIRSLDEDEDDDKALFPYGLLKFSNKIPRPYDLSSFPHELVDLSRLPGVQKKVKNEDECIEKLFQMTEDQLLAKCGEEPSSRSLSSSGEFRSITENSKHSNSSKESTKWDRTYLLNLVGNEDILDALIGNLISERSDDQIQEFLFDLLGFDRIELITELLSNRAEVVKQINREEAVAQAIRNQVLAGNTSQAHPVIGVKIQSAEEKLLEKLYRKEDKKAQKHGINNLANAYSSQILQAEVQTGENMRNRIQTCYAIQESLATRGVGTELSGGYYPNVYDQFAAVKKTAGCISGAKMVLPESAKRTQTSDYEEIDMPASKTRPPPEVEARPLKAISELDETAQKVFKGMKQLNRIQSMVYDTAYNTNENMLVCAPTGAGKTNIALLSVLHCINENTEAGTILKDQFKIVYVAPMKALAAEMTANFSKRLSPLGIQVRELTGDMQLTKTEIAQTQMLITTPEKWDVVTRKSTGDVGLSQIVKLLIIDEVHLLHGDRGPVVESLVARTLRQVESSQRMIRIVGLSATLPNYKDVAQFLRVNPKGLYYFDSRFRPVPLGQTFVGVKAIGIQEQHRQMESVCYEKVYQMVKRGHQVMVFVHARNATLKTAQTLIEMGANKGQLDTFSIKGSGESSSDYGRALKALTASRNKKLAELFQYGFAVHHAGMLRSDRNLIEKYFGDGLCRVLVCTATLAWGVNLPAHAVVIKGTEIYDAQRGSFVDLGILDVLQIFGRAGRPQFDTEGHGTIITTHDKLSHYLGMLTNQYPIESSFIKYFADNLNAEVSLGSVTNVEEAMEWLMYTYLYIRMRRNPVLYGVQYQEAQNDPNLDIKRRELVVESARNLEKAQMIRFDERTEYLHSTDMGRTASHFYIKYDTIETFNEIISPVMAHDLILMMISKASEFEQVKVRDEELDELDDLTKEYCYLKVWGGSENVHGKVNILLQTYISRGFIKSFSLVSDQQYIIQNAIRICRGYFEVVLRKNNPLLAGRFLEFSKMLDQQLWDFSHPLRQHKHIGVEIQEKLEKKKISIDTLRETNADEIGLWIHHKRMGATVKRCAEEFPQLDCEVSVQPITRTVLRVKLIIRPDFRWNDRMHGNVAESFWIWVENPEDNYMYHHEYFILGKKHVMRKEPQDLIFTIPIQEPFPTQYLIRVVSDRFLGCTQVFPVSFQNLILPEDYPPHTDLLDLEPLPITALKDTRFENLYSSRFDYFNAIQTQIFHCLYHSDTNALVGAPTGSGKTIAAEMAIFRVFKVYPRTKVVYIAPLKALVRERIIDWKDRFERRLGKKVVELTGDVTPDARAIAASDVIVTTPEKWDGISRSWQTRSYVQAVSLIVIDEIHLLGEDRGPVLEVIVSRTNFISQHTQRNLRVIGLSTALANARDLADWLGIKGVFGLFNFRPSVRPVPIQVHIQGFPGKHYCPRMATMNKPTFQSIREHSPSKPSLVFVSSRRQTRLTALDLIAYLAGEGNPKQWLHMNEYEMEQIIARIKEPNLKLTLAFGIGIHHAGLHENDRKVVEELFVNQKIQILIATATLAWGVNFPAHLVVIKGTEYYDGKTHRYVDMPITDVLQMMGRAGRPQFDDNGVAVVLVHDQKKNFYKKFLYEPFPVESSLLDVLPDHLNAEVVAGTISSTQEAMDYLTCTYFFRRLLQNPSYYNLTSSDSKTVNEYLSNLITRAFGVLESASCLHIHDDLRTVEPSSFGRIAAYYYLSHQTMQLFRDRLNPVLTLQDVLTLLCDVYEYSQLPVRHNEDILNEELAKTCPLEVAAGTYNSPHTKANLLLQCHMSRKHLPSSDYYTDLKSVLDQALRILQAMIDACAENGWLCPTLNCINLIQMIVQARWLEDDDFMSLPYINEQESAVLVRKLHVYTIPQLQSKTKSDSSVLDVTLGPYLESNEINTIYRILHEIPAVAVDIDVQFDGRSAVLPYTSKTGAKVWMDVPPATDVVLRLGFERLNMSPKDMKVHASKFPKPKDESWFLILGDCETQEVVALKRFAGIRKQAQTQLALTTPTVIGRWSCSLYIMCDSYFGVDQQYELNFNVTKSAGSKPPPGFDLLKE